MSKEELKQKAEVCMHNILFWLKLPISKENVEKGGAYILKLLEPGEKRIEELEQKLEQTEKDLADYQFNYPKIKELSKENAELKQQIEKMKCGQNCKHLYINLCDLNFRTCSNCKDKWEIKENE